MSPLSSSGKQQLIVQDISADDALPAPTRIGFMREQLADFEVPADFNEMMHDEIIALFESGKP